MKRSTFPIRIAGLVGMIVLLVVVVAQPAGALLNQEPTPRPTPTAAPYVELTPVQGIAGDPTPVVASGALWTSGGTVTLYWDEVDETGVELGQAVVTNEGTFVIPFDTPTDPVHATVGVHSVFAVQGETQAEVFFELLQGVPTDTPTPTNTATPPTPPTSTFTPSPTLTPTETPTLEPTPTLRPVTPMATISPIPPTRRPPSRTSTPRPTRTNTPVPGPATNTPRPTITLIPTDTPGPGTPSVTPQATATPVDEIADTGAGWGTFVLWGFVLAALLVVFRVLRVRSLPG